MFQTTKSNISSKLNKIDKKLEQLQGKKHQAINNRIRQLQNQIQKDNITHLKQKENAGKLQQQMKQYRQKLKSVYTQIFHGMKEIGFRKNNLTRQIKGMDQPSSYA